MQPEIDGATTLAPPADPVLIGQTPIAHSATLGLLFAAFAAAQGDFPAKVEADSTGWVGRVEDGRAYSYADLGSVLEGVRKPLQANGLGILSLPTLDHDLVSVTFVLTHSSGEWLSVSFALYADVAKPQAVGSVMTYLARYLASKVLMVASDKDDDGAAATAANSRRRAPVGGYDPDTDAPRRPARQAPRQAPPPPPPAGTRAQAPLLDGSGVGVTAAVDNVVPEGPWTKALWSDFYTLAKGRAHLDDGDLKVAFGPDFAKDLEPADLFAGVYALEDRGIAAAKGAAKLAILDEFANGRTA